MPIGQLVFYTTERAAQPYNKKGDAKYLDQRQATLSRYHANRRGPANAGNEGKYE
jgi:dCTP deaminase